MGWRRWATVGFASGLLTIFVVAPAHAAHTYPVKSTADTVDPSPGDADCNLNPCTLRAAIQSANNDPGSTINIDPSITPYALTLGGAGEDAAATGDLDITASVAINGAGAASTVIDGGDLDRVIEVRSGTVTITGVTIRNGQTPVGFTNGGGVRAIGTSNVTLNDATVTQNRAMIAGGGLESENDATLTLNRVTVSENVAHDGGGNGNCGGVAEENNAPATGGVFVNDSTIAGNSATFGGAGCEEGGGRMDIVNSVVRDNFLIPGDIVPEGGGLVEDGSGVLNVIRSTVSGNTAAYGAGVVEDGGGSVTITDSTIAANHAVARPSGAEMFASSNGSGGGLVEDAGGTVTITGSTFTGNIADNNGGGMFFQGGRPTRAGGPVQITNSTIAGNSAGPGGGGIRIDLRNGLNLLNTTVAGNTAAAGGDLNICVGGPAPSGGFSCFGGMTLRNTIVSGGGASNCAVASGTIASAGHNLDSGTTCGFGATGDKTSADPKLNALAANGGPTQTESLQDGSAAIDSADSCPATDQRGIGRPFGPACDIGAFEGGIPLIVVPPVNKPPAEKPAPDLAVASRAACLSIPGVVRDQKARAPGGGKVVLHTGQVDDPGHPLRTAVRASGGARVKSVVIKVNGRKSAGSVPQNLLRLGSKAKRNKVTATVVLKNGKRVTLTQFMIVLKCSTPATRCTRLADGKSMRCTSKTPLGGRRVRITASRTTTEVAKGSATVKKGKYTAVLRSTVPLAAGTYAYKHIVTTKKPKQRYYMIRKVTVT